jgi:oxygen-independent coproporphyrinogen-3 oxidase
LLEPYAGFGSDAHSFDGRLRWQNPESVNEYLGAWQPVSVERNPLEERFFVGLRLTQGIRPEPREWEYFGEPIRRFIEQGLLETQGDVLRLTNRGVMLSNEVFQEFLT